MSETHAPIEPTEADFRALANEISQLAWIGDGTGAIFWYNRPWHDFTALPPERMLGWDWRRVHHPDHVERVSRGLAQAFASGEPWEDTLPLRHHSGEYRWFLSRARPLRGSGDCVARWFGTQTDITAARKRECERNLAERRLKLLIEATGSIVWTADAEGRLIGQQPGWTAFTGQDEAAYAGWGWRAAVHPADAAVTARVWEAALRSRSAYRAEHRLRRADGQWRDVAVHGVPLLGEDGAIDEWVGSYTDITERKLLSDDLTAALEAAEAANRAKSHFLANMSHELRTPLSAVIGYGEMLQEEMEDAGQSHLLPDLDKINANARHLLSLINDLLDLSRIEANEMTVFAEDFPVAALLDEVTVTVEKLVHKRNNSIAVEASADLGSMHSDRVKLRQCLSNLIGNAAKFTEEGSITLTAWRERRHATDWIMFAVQDSGIGMSEQQVGWLFERFAPADASTTRTFGGLGLGLAITRGFVALLDGEIKVESAFGVGTTLTIGLPASYRAPALPEHGRLTSQH